MRKLSTLLLRRPVPILKKFLILFCLFGGAETFAQVITPPNNILAPTSTTLSSTANPSIAGQPVIITATVTSPGLSGPTGTVDFYDNDANIDLTPGGIAMSNGIATYETSALGVDVNIKATYSGDAGNLPSTSSVLAQIVSHPEIIGNATFYTTTITLVSNTNPSVAGSQPVTFTATVSSSGDANLTGKVDFYDNTDNKDLTPGGVALVDGVAKFKTSSLDFGDLNITAAYSGDANGNQSSTSSSLLQHVAPDIQGLGVALELTSTSTTTEWGAPLVFIATVQGGPVFDGTITFADNGNVLGSAPVDGSGKARFPTIMLSPGSHSITASFFSLTSNVLIQSVNAPYTPISFVAPGSGGNPANIDVLDDKRSTNPIFGTDPDAYGQQVTFEAIVAGDPRYMPTGTVDFMAGDTLLGSEGLDATGTALFTTSILSIGTHNIYAVYGGDDIYLGNSTLTRYDTGPITAFVNVTRASTSTTVSSSLNPSVAGQQVTFIASVAVLAPSGTGGINPLGNVTFTIDGIAQNPVPLNGTGNGFKAFLDISSLSSGSHTIKATYSGDGNYGGSSSGNITQTVGAVGSSTLNFLGSSQSTLINTFFPNGLLFDIMDLNPNLAGGAAITFTAPSSGASGTFSNGTTTITVHTTALGSVGEADSGPFKANGVAGSYTVIASIPGLGTDNFTLTNTAPTVQITIGSSVTGISFIVDGLPLTTAQTFNWVPGSSHSIATTALQAGPAGTQYVFTGWSDGTNTLSDNITVPSTATSYTANFITQYQLTITANPSNGGTVSPASGAFYNAGDVVPLNATANTGYAFSSWTGNVASTGVASTSVTMNAPQNVSANFDQLSATVPVTVGTSVPGLSFSVDGTTYTTSQTFGWFPGDIHFIGTSATQAGGAGTQYVLTSWTNGGGGFVTAPSTATTYTANFKTQYQLTTISSPASGSSGSITPASGNFYDAGTIIGVQAYPDAGSLFSGFTGDLTGTGNPQILGMNGPKTVNAGFAVDCQPVTWLYDGDNDGYYSSEFIGVGSCTAPGPGWKPASSFTKGVDCDDNDPLVTTGKVWYKDADNDGYSDGATKTQCDQPTGYKLAADLTATSGDCNDNDATVWQSTTLYIDKDGDGYDAGTATVCYGATIPAGYSISTNGSDCNDNDANVHTSPTISIQSGTTTCSDSKATITASSSASNPTYSWYSDAAGQNLLQQSTSASFTTPVLSGNTIYYVSVADGSAGCTSVLTPAPVTVNPLPVVAAITYSGSTTVCSAATVTLSDAGGTWSTSGNAATVTTAGVVNFATVAAATNVTISYRVTSNGCSKTVGLPFTVNPPISVKAITGTTSICGAGTITLSDATGGGTWSSNNTAVATLNSSTGVATGKSVGSAMITYTVSSGGCTASVSTTVSVKASPTVAVISGTSVLIKGTSSTMSDATKGGTWSSSNTAVATVTSSGSVKGISAGTCTIYYTITSGSCSAVASKPVTVYNPLSASVTAGKISCNGSSTTLTINVTGGSGGYQYSLNAGKFQTGNTYTVNAGTYLVVVKDNMAEQFTISGIIIGQPAALALKLTKETNASSKTAANGSFTVSGSGGTPAYQYSKNGGSTYQTSGTFGSLAPGTYKVSIKDANNCVALNKLSVTVGYGTALSLSEAAMPQISNDDEIMATASPNPTETEFKLTLSGNNKQVELRVIDMYGRIVYHTTGSANQSYRFGERFTSGVYIIEILQGKVVKNLKVIKGK